jgi:hypothetical protein
MNNVKIYHAGKGKTIYEAEWPSRWDEMSTAQFIRVTKELFENDDVNRAKAKVAFAFLNNPLLALRLPFGEAFELGDAVSFVFKENPMSRKSFFPLLGRFNQLKGPEDNFVNFTAWQFASAETAFGRMASAIKNKEGFSRLAGCLIMPAWQKKFDDSKLKKNIRRAERLHPNTLKALFFNYTLMRSALSVQYPNVFNGGEKKPSKFGWMGIMQKLPGDVFGPLEKRADEPLHNVLLHLEMAALDAAEMDKKFAKK